MDVKELEKLAIAAHRRGEGWSEFWTPETAELVRQAQPYDGAAYQRLSHKLLHLLICGNGDGHRPVDLDAPQQWDLDHAQHEAAMQPQQLDLFGNVEPAA